MELDSAEASSNSMKIRGFDDRTGGSTLQSNCDSRYLAHSPATYSAGFFSLFRSQMPSNVQCLGYELILLFSGPGLRVYFNNMFPDFESENLWMQMPIRVDIRLKEGLPELLQGDETFPNEDLAELVLGDGDTGRMQLVEFEGTNM